MPLTNHKKQLARLKLARENAFTTLEGDKIDSDPCGHPPAIHARRYLTTNLNDHQNIEKIKSSFLDWVADERYLLFMVKKTGKIFSLPASKRGNPVYARRVAERFDYLAHRVPDHDYFAVDPSVRGVRSTSLIFVTLTYNRRRVSRDAAWVNLAHNYNLFMARLRRAFPGSSIAALRGNEAHKDGYPHVHCLIAFSSPLPVLRHTGENGGSWRIPYNLKETIAGCWSWGFSDTLAMASARGGIGYISKYIIKGLIVDPTENKSALYAFAIQWAKGMRAFSFSRKFLEILGGRLESPLHNSTPEYVYIGTFPPCFRECLHLNQKIPDSCPFLRLDGG